MCVVHTFNCAILKQSQSEFKLGAHNIAPVGTMAPTETFPGVICQEIGDLHQEMKFKFNSLLFYMQYYSSINNSHLLKLSHTTKSNTFL